MASRKMEKLLQILCWNSKEIRITFFRPSKSPHEKCDLLNVYIDINVSDWSISLTIIEKTVLPILKQVFFDKYILLLMNSQCWEIFACYIHGYFFLFFKSTGNTDVRAIVERKWLFRWLVFESDLWSFGSMRMQFVKKKLSSPFPKRPS